MKNNASQVYPFSTGSDFELALFNTTLGQYTLSEYYTSGTKSAPEYVNGYGLQADNVSYEVAVPVSTTQQEFVQTITGGIETIQSSLPPEIELRYIPSADYDPELLKTSENAMLFGCDPDYDAYSGDINSKPSPGEITSTRYFGFHVHIGYQNATEETSQDIVKVLDANLLVPFLIRYGVDMERLRLYGRPGNHRIKQYGKVDGVEYRSLDARAALNPAPVYAEVANAVNFVMRGNKPDHTVDDVYSAILSGTPIPRYQ